MKFVLSSQYGVLEQIREGAHTGVDIAMPIGTPLRSIVDGVVSKVDIIGNRNIGREVVIQDDHGVSHIYGHLSEVDVRIGDHVDRGDLIGLSGNTGHTTGPHLHYGEWVNGHFINPTAHANDVANLSGGSASGSAFWEGPLTAKLHDHADDYMHGVIWHFLGAVRDVSLDLIDSVALLGSGVLLLLHVGGMQRASRYIWIMIILRIIIKFLLGGYLT